MYTRKKVKEIDSKIKVIKFHEGKKIGVILG